jgi:hypothetical protein
MKNINQQIKTMIRKLLLMAALLSSTFTFAEEVNINDDGTGTGTTTWTSNNTYILNGFVFVNDGDTLTIEAGTVIKGAAGTQANASALIVARGAFIRAEGTAEDPIIMTFYGDPLDGSIPYTTKGQWGGFIILGSAKLNSVPGESAIEGIPTTEMRGLYGGTNDADNSGIVKYVSVRHGGTDIGAGNEINGITFGGVGSGTTIDYVEVISNADDGLEFFGGTVCVKHAVVSFCGDDSFDYDEGFRGFGQYWVTMHEPNAGDRGGEHDGGTDPENGIPYATPTIYNATYIGRGIDAGKRTITFRDNAGGWYANSIFANWGKGVDIEKLASGQDSYARFMADSLALEGNIFYDVVVEGTGATAEDLFKVSFGSGAEDNGETTLFQASFAENDNEVADPGITYLFEEDGMQLVPTEAVVLGGVAPIANCLDSVTYRGAFAPNTESWLLGWTLVDEYGYIAEMEPLNVDEKVELQGRIYPNPVIEKLTIELKESTEILLVDVYSIDGKLVKSFALYNVIDRIEIDLSELNSGFHIVNLRANKTSKSFKVFIR